MTYLNPNKTRLIQRLARAWRAMGGGFFYRFYVVLVGICFFWIVLLCSWKVGGNIARYIFSNPDYWADATYVFDAVADNKTHIFGTAYPTWLCFLVAITIFVIGEMGMPWKLIGRILTPLLKVVGKALSVMYQVAAALIKPFLVFLGIWLLITHPLHFIALAVAFLAWIVCDWCAKNPKILPNFRKQNLDK